MDMITARKSRERGATRIGWLDSRHTFSFGDYHDPAHMGFRSLRVINDDRITPAAGFGTHPHRDMEIFTWVLDGALAHEDSLGNGSVIRPGDAQRMSAGTGIRHSEFNHARSEPCRLLQIWILPERSGIEPGYEQKAYAPAELQGQLRLIGSRDGREGSITLHQDVALYAGRLGPGQSASLSLAPGRHAWVQVARGAIELNGQALGEGDGAAASGEQRLELRGEGEVLVFDLA
jgi:redox-sensitive bicupin YhaK (pirin superfamily)